MSDSIRRLYASSIDGRAQNPRYAQKQLRNLFDTLVEQKSKIKAALKGDTSYLLAEVEAEYYLTLATVREAYNSINIAKTLDEEYSIAAQKDHPTRRIPVGCVCISPARHTPLYAAIAPLSAAIVAGNCVALELKQTLSELNALLRQVLTAALDSATFAVVDKRPADDQLFTSFVTIQDDNGTSAISPSWMQLICPSLSRVVAVVDRTADIQTAAKNAVQARFSFRGRSPYAPDLVLVNEFALKDFCIAVVQKATTYMAAQVDESTNGFATDPARRNEEKDESLKALAEGDVETLVSASRGRVVLVKNRKSILLRHKLAHPTLVIHAVSSLDDAIDFSTSSTSSPLLATYLFAAPTSAKYLSQFIPSALSYTNGIPSSLLFGPAYALGFTACLSATQRFTADMFTRAAPEFITPHPSAHALAEVLYRKSPGQVSLCQETLPPMGQSEGGAVGFFEQGLLTGMSLWATGLVGMVAALGVYFGPAVVRRLR